MGVNGLLEVLWTIGEDLMAYLALDWESHEHLTHSIWERALYENFMADQQASQKTESRSFW